MTCNGKSQSQSSPLIKRRILLVAQDAAVLLTLKAVLEMNDFQVETASSTGEALEKMASGKFHMVITEAWTDNESPGRDVLRAARRQPYDPATALLTTNPAPDGDWHGAHTVLIKPIGTEDLLRQLEALLIRHEDEKRLRRGNLQLVEGRRFKGERSRRVS